jgi:hypothetical protein
MKSNQYPLFEQWYKTTNVIISLCEKYPKSVRFTFANRMINLALDITELITEAIYKQQRKPILIKINLYLEKLRFFFRMSFDRRYISGKQYENISRNINEAGKMTGGWLKTSL